MTRQEQKDKVFMEVAHSIASLSRCERRKVGAVIVLKDNSMVYGFNGTPKGTDNCCEDSDGLTRPDVIHAELNAVLKAVGNAKNLHNSCLYVTVSPCERCAALMVQTGVSRVVWNQDYNNLRGIEYLRKHKVKCVKLV